MCEKDKRRFYKKMSETQVAEYKKSFGSVEEYKADTVKGYDEPVQSDERRLEIKELISDQLVSVGSLEEGVNVIKKIKELMKDEGLNASKNFIFDKIVCEELYTLHYKFGL